MNDDKMSDFSRDYKTLSLWLLQKNLQMWFRILGSYYNLCVAALERSISLKTIFSMLLSPSLGIPITEPVEHLGTCLTSFVKGSPLQWSYYLAVAALCSEAGLSREQQMPSNNASDTGTQRQKKAPVLREVLGTGSEWAWPWATRWFFCQHPPPKVQAHAAELSRLGHTLQSDSYETCFLEQYSFKIVEQNRLLNICKCMKQSVNLRTHNAHCPMNRAVVVSSVLSFK